tara:strand:+ start:504 stop:710 length:207 start_codon:yes stop_codon:yes gene_type:complete
MAHLHMIEDSKGDAVDQIVFCSDFCHQDYLIRENLIYGGWFGCQEISITEPCANCETEVEGIETMEGI